VADEALSEFLNAYDVHRIKDQETYYEKRMNEYVVADRQAGAVAETMLFLAGVSGIIAAAWPEYALWLGVIATAFAATATVVAGWSELIGFSKNAQMFRAASDRLALARPDRPMGSEVGNPQAQAYIARMEGILLTEVRSWGKEWGHANGDPSESD
jgi:hypothetical protein